MSNTEQQPFVAEVAGAVLLPVAKDLLKAGVGAAVARAAKKVDVPLAPAEAPRVAVAVANEMAKDPIVINTMNAEPAYQSRVVWGSTIAALGVVVPPIAGLFGFDLDGSKIVEFLSAIVTLSGAGYALYGRLTKGLAPLFSRDK